MVCSTDSQSMDGSVPADKSSLICQLVREAVTGSKEIEQWLRDTFTTPLTLLHMT